MLQPGPRMIMGGAPVEPYSIPWQVYIRVKGIACGGTLISHRHVLTATHCTTEWFGGQFQYEFDVVVGEHSLSDASDGYKYRVCDFVDHPRYRKTKYYIDYDFSILFLKRSVQFGQRVRPAYLPDSRFRGNFFAGKMLTVSGWGRWYYGGPTPNVLYSVKVPGITQAQCKRNYNWELNRRQIRSNNLCAGRPSGDIDACQGDSGGMFLSMILS